MRKHTEGHVTVPSVPGTHLVLIQPDLSFGFLETLFHRPAAADGVNHLQQSRALGSKHQHVGQLRRFGSHLQAPSHDQPALPPTGLRLSQFDTCPIEEPRSFAPRASTQTLPGVCGQATRDLICSLTNTLYLDLLDAAE